MKANSIQTSILDSVREEGGLLSKRVNNEDKAKLDEYLSSVRDVEKRLTFRRRWTAGALWEDTRFDAKHFNDIERLAIVGETKREKGMTLVCKPFTTVRVRSFDQADIDKAGEWLAK